MTKENFSAELSKKTSPIKKGHLFEGMDYFLLFLCTFPVLTSFLCCSILNIYIFLQLLSDGKPAQSKRLLTEEPQLDRTLRYDHQQEGNG